MSPDEAGEDDVKVDVDDLTFVLTKRDADFLKSLGGVHIDENRLFGGLSVRTGGAQSRSCC